LQSGLTGQPEKGWTIRRKQALRKKPSCPSPRSAGNIRLLGRIGRNRFACVFPHLTAADGQALARELIDASADAQNHQLTIGVAAYPTINYTRHQIVNNAEKALEHASFFGPGTITGSMRSV
jgi:GGDEF domain-containing protein